MLGQVPCGSETPASSGLPSLQRENVTSKQEEMGRGGKNQSVFLTSGYGGLAFCL